jgi:hypothetical protein
MTFYVNMALIRVSSEYGVCGVTFVPVTFLLRLVNIIAWPLFCNVKKSITEPITHQSVLLSSTNRKINYAPL